MIIHSAARAVASCRSCCCGSPAARSFSTRSLHRHRTALVQARWGPASSASSGAWQRSPQRRLSSAAPGGAADGKPGPKPLDRGNTPMGKGFDVLSSESGSKCVITGYDPHGFDVGRVNARSSILAFPGSFLLWAPRSFDEITLESLELIALTEPKVRVKPLITATYQKYISIASEHRDTPRSGMQQGPLELIALTEPKVCNGTHHSYQTYSLVASERGDTLLSGIQQVD
eukprot:TRINITY_DN2153_c0_g1_i2.p1 TRINITY_DN2153_c0_g1~~TRINITY_DN2153_c0_g1_i2.p1  ORF type:complete len:230 (-),score=28.41 TRINITY_DN2153_c0_g1_i2:1315-2004(-)